MRGTEKRVIWLRNPESRFFEGAIFLLREPLPSSRDSDIVKEANRILREGENDPRVCEAAGRSRRLLWFALGLVVSAAGILLLQVLF